MYKDNLPSIFPLLLWPVLVFFLSFRDSQPSIFISQSFSLLLMEGCFDSFAVNVNCVESFSETRSFGLFNRCCRTDELVNIGAVLDDSVNEELHDNDSEPDIEGTFWIKFGRCGEFTFLDDKDDNPNEHGAIEERVSGSDGGGGMIGEGGTNPNADGE